MLPRCVQYIVRDIRNKKIWRQVLLYNEHLGGHRSVSRNWLKVASIESRGSLTAKPTPKLASPSSKGAWSSPSAKRALITKTDPELGVIGDRFTDKHLVKNSAPGGKNVAFATCKDLTCLVGGIILFGDTECEFCARPINPRPDKTTDAFFSICYQHCFYCHRDAFYIRVALVL